MDFASPTLSDMPENASGSEIEKALSIAFAVWNAVVLDDVRGTGDWVARVRELIAPSPQGALLIEQLLDRKRTRFGDDHRLIGRYRVTRQDDELNLWAEARDPYSIPPGGQ